MPSFLSNLLGGARNIIGNLFNRKAGGGGGGGSFGPSQFVPQPNVDFTPVNFSFDPSLTQTTTPQVDINSGVDAVMNTATQSVQSYIDPFFEASKRAGEFEEKNPFSFDEAQARASSEERFNPFYDAELNDFMTGITNQLQRSSEDTSRLLRELTTQTENFVGKARRSVQDALEGAREGFAGAGLFFGGQRVRREGRIKQEGEEGVGDFLRRQDLRSEEARLSQKRFGEDVELRKGTFTRKLGAQKETDIQKDVSRQRADALRQREFERQQFVGSPLATASSSLSNIYGI